ncbi:transcriptional repressor [Pseudobutyrivibrio sp.]|uniref:transcriptional repressor n=1 Tax=Pseudobutyrivibrio sp. TaxID=2014367 RepID=UPI001D6EF6F1|nr:transcriptional repressor [Pseudobutyrivibrio sp.]MBE5910944.1 Fur family transcriptional regulator [Pseudobutyrivibrio sp.]
MDVLGNEQRQQILQQLREAGCRITKQRMIILDIILNGEPSCVKEIYREAIKQDKNIGTATVYRMVNTLEEIGVINRKNMYQVDCSSCELHCDDEDCDGDCMGECANCETRIVVTLDDDSKIVIDRNELQDLLQVALKAKGRINNQKISRLAM